MAKTKAQPAQRTDWRAITHAQRVENSLLEEQLSMARQEANKNLNDALTAVNTINDLRLKVNRAADRLDAAAEILAGEGLTLTAKALHDDAVDLAS